MTDKKETAYQHKIFKKHDIILKEGDISDSAYLILKGKVEIRLGHFGESPRTLATLGEGNVIGELALFDNRPHMATVVAIEKTEVSAMSRDEFQRMIAAMDPVMKGMVGMMVTRMRQVVVELIPNAGDIDRADWRK